MHPKFTEEVRRACNVPAMLSRGALNACGVAVQRIAPIETSNLVTVNTIGTPARRTYLDYPEWEEWRDLERAGVVDENGMVFFMVDALH
jgi:hypothetical protein